MHTFDFTTKESSTNFSETAHGRRGKHVYSSGAYTEQYEPVRILGSSSLLLFEYDVKILRILSKYLGFLFHMS